MFSYADYVEERGIRQGRAEGIKQGKSLGRAEEKWHIIENMLATGRFSNDMICRLTNITEEELETYKQQKSAAVVRG